jgi:hypothetical protein
MKKQKIVVGFKCEFRMKTQRDENAVFAENGENKWKFDGKIN